MYTANYTELGEADCFMREIAVYMRFYSCL